MIEIGLLEQEDNAYSFTCLFREVTLVVISRYTRVFLECPSSLLFIRCLAEAMDGLTYPLPRSD